MKELIRVRIGIELHKLEDDQETTVKDILNELYHSKCHRNTFILSINKFRIMSYPIVSLVHPTATLSLEILADTYNVEVGTILVGCEYRNNDTITPYYNNIKIIMDGSTCISDKMSINKFNVEILNVSYPDDSRYMMTVCRKSFLSPDDNNVYKAVGNVNDEEQKKLDELKEEIDKIKIPKYIQDAFIVNKSKGDIDIADITDGTVCSRMNLNIHDGRLYDKSDASSIIEENIFPLKYKLLKIQLNHRRMMSDMEDTYEKDDPIYKVFEMYKKVKK